MLRAHGTTDFDRYAVDPAQPLLSDLFLDDKPLTYKLREKGYQFYSVGVNGNDDGGQSFNDDPRGDDLAVRVPRK